MKRLRVGARTTVAFQGELGAFSQQASRRIFGPDVRHLPCMTFDDVFEAVSRKSADLAVIPIENSLAGTHRSRLCRMKSRWVFAA